MPNLQQAIGGYINGVLGVESTEIGGFIDGLFAHKIGGFIYSGLIDQMGSSSVAFGGIITGQDVYTYMNIGGFIEASFNKQRIGAFIQGIEDQSDTSINGYILGQLIGESNNAIRGLILGAQPTTEAIGGFIKAPDAQMAIGGLVFITDELFGESIHGLVNGIIPDHTIGGLIFRPPAVSERIRGFMSGVVPVTSTQGGFIHGLTDTSEAIGALINGLGESNMGIGGQIVGITEIESEAIGGLVSGILGSSDVNIGGLIFGITDNVGEAIGALIIVHDEANNKFRGFIVGGF